MQDLVSKEKALKDSWINISCSELSADEIKRKLEQIRATRPTNLILRPVHDAHKDVLSKTGEIEKIKQELQSIELQQSQLHEKLQQDIAAKNVYVEQVHTTLPVSARTCVHKRAEHPFDGRKDYPCARVIVCKQS